MTEIRDEPVVLSSTIYVSVLDHPSKVVSHRSKRESILESIDDVTDALIHSLSPDQVDAILTQKKLNLEFKLITQTVSQSESDSEEDVIYVDENLHSSDSD